MTVQEAKRMIINLNEIFFLARIVDPETQMVWDVNEQGEFVPVQTCYHVWRKKSPCENCKTKMACRNRTTVDKYEILDEQVYHINSKPVEIDGGVFAFEIVMRLDNADDMNRREVLLREQEQNMEIIKILASEYSSVYYIDLSTDALNPYTMNAQTETELGQIFSSGITYSRAFALYVERLVHPEDRDMMLKAGSVSNIRAQLAQQKTFITQYRSTDNRYCEMKFVKVDADNEAPTAVALGFSDRDEEVRLQAILTRNQEIIQTLSDEYTSVYHVDLNTQEMTLTKLSEEVRASVGNQFYQGMPFSEALRIFLREQVKNTDYDELSKFGSVKYLKKLLANQKSFSRSYRVGTEDHFRYNEMKIVKVGEGKEPSAIVLGIADKDAEIRERMKEAVEQRRNIEIIEILASEYTSVYYIDLTTDALTPYSMNEETENQFGVLFKNMRYSEAFRMYVDTLIYPADKAMMLRSGSIGNIMRELRNKKTFLTTYRSDNNGEPRYCEMKFVKVGSEEGAPTAVALGFADKDEELRHSIEQETIRKRNTEIIEILASEYTSVYYIDLTTDELDPYTMNEETESEFGKVFRSGINYTDAFRLYVDTMVHPDDKAMMLRAGSMYNILEELRDKKSFQTTYRSSNDDVIHYCEMKFVKVGDDDNPQAVALGFSIVDEAYRRELESKQREELINGLADDYEAVFHIDLDTREMESVRMTREYVLRNPNVEKHMDYEAFVAAISENIVPDDLEDYVYALSPENIEREFAENNAFFHNYSILKRGEVSYYQLKIIHTGPWESDHNFLIGVHNMDETMRAQVAQEESLREAREEAEYANKAKSTFLFNMSHDIRTPMNAIMGFNSMAMKHLDDPARVMDYLKKVDTSSQHLLSIINDVLDMARIESGKVTIQEEWAQITQAASDVVSIVINSVREKDLQLITDFTGIVHDYIYVDVLRVNRVMMNIMTNAIKYTNPGGTVSYTIREVPSGSSDRAAYHFIIRDNGIGMSKEYLAHAFEAFTRESSSTVSRIQGTGLGMAITKELVELMNGTIHIDSEAGVGTTVTIRLDFRLADEQAPEEALEMALDPSVLKGRRVLLVEDNELNREIAKEILEEYEMLVEEADDGTVAVEKCTAAIERGEPDYYDLILMDVQMPQMNGYDATVAIRALPGQARIHTPIIAMTANAFAEDKKKALDSGMDAHIAKPINVKEMLEKMTPFLD